MSISPSKRNLGTTWGKENSFWPRPRTHARSPSWICCCSTDYAVNPAWSESWVICVVVRIEGRMCNCTYLIIYYLPCTLLALCSKWSTDNYLCPEWKFIKFYKTPLYMYPILIKRLLQRVFLLFVIVSGFLWLPYCGNNMKAAHTLHFNRWVLWVYRNPSFFVNWFFPNWKFVLTS